MRSTQSNERKKNFSSTRRDYATGAERTATTCITKFSTRWKIEKKRLLRFFPSVRLRRNCLSRNGCRWFEPQGKTKRPPLRVVFSFWAHSTKMQLILSFKIKIKLHFHQEIQRKILIVGKCIGKTSLSLGKEIH